MKEDVLRYLENKKTPSAQAVKDTPAAQVAKSSVARQCQTRSFIYAACISMLLQ